MVKRRASLLSFCQTTHKRQWETVEKADDQDQESDSSDRQDVLLTIAQKKQFCTLNSTCIFS